jgi:uncharacterized protein (DUF2236 family)
VRSPALDRYARDGAIVAGGAAAILLQVADPVVARGVAERSSFRVDPMRRLRHTLAFVYGVMAGDARQRERVAVFTDAAHAGVPGAREIDHQLWVAATLYQVGRSVQERLHGPLPPELDAEVLAASADLGAVLQVPPDRWPADRAAFDAYWEQQLAKVHIDDTVREYLYPIAASRIRGVRLPGLVQRRNEALALLITTGFLPQRFRDEMQLPWDARRQRRFDRLMALLRTATHLSPRAVRQFPFNVLLKDLDWRIRTGRPLV